jgi:hypothetical protein
VRVIQLPAEGGGGKGEPAGFSPERARTSFRLRKRSETSCRGTKAPTCARDDVRAGAKDCRDGGEQGWERACLGRGRGMERERRPSAFPSCPMRCSRTSGRSSAVIWRTAVCPSSSRAHVFSAGGDWGA